MTYPESSIRKIASFFREKIDSPLLATNKVADFLTRSFGTIWFLTVNAIFFLVWILINLGVISNIPIFDPFPFGLLTMIVSLEAIFLSIIVLISQNRASQVADVRSEMDFEINVQAESEITKMLGMLHRIHNHLGIPVEDDGELSQMEQKTDLEKLKSDILQKKSR